MARKPTKCSVKGCVDAPAFVITTHAECHENCGIDGKAFCLEHGRPFIFSLVHSIVALWDPAEPPRAIKKALAKRK